MNKKIKIIGIIFLIMLVGFTIFVYQLQYEKEKEIYRFVGKWTGEISNASGTWNFSFFKNSSVLISKYLGLESGNIPSHWEKYDIKNNLLYIQIYPHINPECLNYHFSKNDTYLETTGNIHFMLKKIG
jgi:hypothetical protein